MPFSEALKAKVRAMAQHKCCMCGKPIVDIHHITPESAGGASTEDNAAPLCAGCHALYGNNPDFRKQIREMRDAHYDRCKQPNVESMAADLAAATRHLSEVFAGYSEKERGYQEEIDRLTDKAARLSAAAFQEAIERRLERDSYSKLENWPDHRSDEKAFLDKATHELLMVILDGRERYLYYHLLKWGSEPIKSEEFLAHILPIVAADFPQPWQVREGMWVLETLSNLRLKGLITLTRASVNPEITIVRPFPHPRDSLLAFNVSMRDSSGT
jgi:hypothetical protein